MDKQGLYRKFKVTRTDGSSRKGQKHANCRYFVLDLDHDPYAMPALEAYANACAVTHHALALDLWEIVRGKPEAGWSQEPPAEQGIYWNWNGDRDCAPMPFHVLYSGFSGKCFVSRGQYDIDVAIDCHKFGGWWMRQPEPPMPLI